MNWAEEYRKSLKMKEVEEIFDLIFYRPIAFLLVRAVYNTRITPNQLSITAIFMGVAAGYFFSLGQPVYFKTGALFYLLFNILDCSDGQLARLKKNGTTAGRIIDGISDYLATIAVYIGIAFGFALKNENNFYWLILLSFAGLSSIIQGILVDYYRTRFLDYVKGGRSNFEKDIEEHRREYEFIKNQKGKRFDRIVLLIYLRYSVLQRLLVSKNRKSKLQGITSGEYFKKNKNLIRFWVFLGPTTQVTIMIICALLNRFDIFIWIMIAGLNTLAAILWLVQHYIDKTLIRES
jgi:phosphatidylglycerophosphate synthase